MTVKKKARKAVNQVTSLCDGYWEWFLSSEPAPYEVTGKYLFFSVDRELLIKIAKEELKEGGFHRAKTHMSDVVPPSGEYVLCLYYKDDSRKRELAAKYQHNPELKYRYWKSDEDTHAGKYSKEFLDRLSRDERKFFLRRNEHQTGGGS